jgi:hypothetical protein
MFKFFKSVAQNNEKSQRNPTAGNFMPDGILLLIV